MRRTALFALVLLSVACDDKDTKGTGPAASSAAATQTAPPPPPPEKPPVVFVEDATISVSGERIETSGDVKGRLAAILASKPKVAGEVIEVQALRDAKVPRVSAAIAALRDAKAKSVVIKTALRDNSLGELAVDLVVPPSCSPVGLIAKDSAILVWPVGGGTATRFTHGMAGPDMTLGSEGMRKLGGSCESKVFVVSGDDTVKWGLVFDLAVAARGGEAGASKQSTAFVPTEVPVAGRKL